MRKVTRTLYQVKSNCDILFLKTASIFVIIAMMFPLSAGAENSFLSTKSLGKLTMIAILSAAAIVVRTLVKRDQAETVELLDELGPPDISTEFQEGFDNWQVMWYEDRVYIFRNHILHRQVSMRGSESKK